MILDGQSTDVAIVGGGIIGLAAAYFLASSGKGRVPAVMVLEAGTIGGQASGRNAGTLSLQNKPPLLTSTCLLGYEQWRQLESSLPGGVGWMPKGGLCVAQTEAEEESLAERYRIRREGGLPLSWLDRRDLAVHHPWLSSSVRAASYNPLDAQANPLLVVFRLRAAAKERGVRVVQHRAVISAEPLDGGWLLATRQGRIRAETVIVAAGGWADTVGSLFGCQIPMERKVPQLAITERLPFLLPLVLVTENNRLSMKQYPSGQAMIGGGWQGYPLEPEYRRTNLCLASVAGNAALMADIVPALKSTRVLRLWSCMEGMSPDRLPYLGPYDGKPGLFFAVEGYGGFTLGLAFARMVVDHLVSGRELPEWAAPDRFARLAFVKSL